MHLSCQNIFPLAMVSFFSMNYKLPMVSWLAVQWAVENVELLRFQILKSGTLARPRQNLSTYVQITETIEIQLNLLISFDNPHKNISSIFSKQRSIQRAWHQQNPLWYWKLKLALMEFASWRGYSKSMPPCLLICPEPAEFLEVMLLQAEC